MQNKLTNAYSDETKNLLIKLLLKFLDNDLEKIYNETTQFIKLILTFPMSAASSERSMSALKRVKTFLRNSMTDARFSNLSILATEKVLLCYLSRDDKFKEHVIDMFPVKETRQIDLVYKQI